MKRKIKLNKKLLSVSRLVHIYVSIALFTLLIFFSVTGITLNHPEWFAAEQSQDSSLDFQVAPELLAEDQQGALLTYLYRQQLLGKGVLTVERSEEEIYISVKRPGVNHVLMMDTASGESYRETSDYGNWALLNDLHKGRNAGLFWSWVIDVTSALFILFGISGFILVIPQKRFMKTVFVATATSSLVVVGYAIS